MTPFAILLALTTPKSGEAAPPAPRIAIDLPPRARCDDRPARYPAMILLAPDPFDTATNELAQKLAEQELIVVRSTNPSLTDLFALAKSHSCAEPSRVSVAARGALAGTLAQTVAAAKLTPHAVLTVKDEDDPKRLFESIVTAAHAEPTDSLTAQKAPFLGLQFSPVPVPFAVSRSEIGLRVDRVLPGQPGWRAGLRKGDVVLALNGEDVGSVPARDAAARMTRRVRALSLGSTAVLKVMRAKVHATIVAEDGTPKAVAIAAVRAFIDETALGAERSLHWTRQPEILSFSVPVTAPPALRSTPLSRSATDEKLAAMLSALSKRRALDETDLFRRIEDGTPRPDPFRLPIVDALQKNPLALRGTVRDLIRRATPDKSSLGSLQRLLLLAEEGTWTTPSPREKSPPLAARLSTGIAPAAHLDQLADLVERAADLRRRALAKLTAEEQRSLPDALRALADLYLENNYVYADDDEDRLMRNTAAIDLAAKIDLAPMLEAAALLASAADPAYLKGLAADLARAKQDWKKPLEKSTANGIIRISGTDSDDQQELDKVALLIDLGGDDFYRERAATGISGVAAIIDVAGDDTYEAANDVAIGAGVLGVGVLVDLAGSDHYLSPRMGQGFGLGGVGVLADFGGKDEYRASQLGQGASLFGVGILHDASGDDRYEGKSHTQAVAVGGGAGMLVDGGGDDVYFSKGAKPSSYGTAGTFDCWCQGIGVGMRHMTSGGLGLLFDGGGHDRVEGGDFSIGAGYYYGLGVAAMQGREADVYIGNRYTLGASAHNGIAAFSDEGGDDRYDTRTMVAQAIANDYSMAWFFDGEGNDRYASKEICGGSSLNNSLALFEDVTGKDVWVGTHAMGEGQSNDYHGGTSLSLIALAPTATAIERRDQHTVIFRQGKRLEDCTDPGP